MLLSSGQGKIKLLTNKTDRFKAIGLSKVWQTPSFDVASFEMQKGVLEKFVYALSLALHNSLCIMEISISLLHKEVCWCWAFELLYK